MFTVTPKLITLSKTTIIFGKNENETIPSFTVYFMFKFFHVTITAGNIRFPYT